ncbi:electron transporter RnfE, partial [Candidatus Falkowbacteria bacterium RIFOXYC2_FULL_48_21]
WVIVVIGAIALIRWLVNQASSKSGGDAKTPLQILQERYAKGEIDKKEFDEKKQALI